MIKSAKSKGMIEIDLTGPNGNVFFLIGQVRRLSELLNTRRGAEYLDPKAIIADMMSADYEHAVEVFDKHFGSIVILYR